MRIGRLGKASFRVHIIRWFLVILVLGTWQAAGSSDSKRHFFYSTPREVAVRLYQESVRGTLLTDTKVTCEEVLLGSLSGLVGGFVVGLILWWFKGLGAACEPLIIGLASIPVFAVAPLLVFWFGVGLSGKVVVVALSVLFISLLATYGAAKQIEDDYSELAKCFHATRGEIFRRLILKGTILIASSSYRMAVIFGFIGAFIAEFISSNAGLGHFMQRCSGLYDVAGILCGLTVFIICSLAIVIALDLVDKRFAPLRSQ